ncbi:MAG TPA: 30S ribosomal protein S6 [Moorella mulderi]|mgnify:CR=1 FL=1|nr:30S ribosomal protein S6 [Moorella mulderi]
MRQYEVVYVLRPDLEAEKIAALVERFKNLVTDQGGEVLEISQWGKRRLAYEIKKFREGYYVLMKFKGKPQVAQELDRVLRITEDVIRFLIAKEEKAG